MDKYIIIKNGLVLTLDRKSQAGYFNIIIKNNKIFLIDQENKFNEKEFKSNYPDAEIIDATNKIIMPGFFNSRAMSSYSLNKFFFKKCTYENLSSWLSLKLIDKYLASIENAELLKTLLKFSYERCLRNGELFVNEVSSSIKKDFFDIYFTNSDWIKQYYNLVIDDTRILSDLRGQEKFLSLGFKVDEDINNYFLSSLKKTLSGYKLKLFIESSLSQKAFESIKKIFGKPFINVLFERDLISSGTIILNPTHLIQPEIEILKIKRASVLISASDYVNFSTKKIDLDELMCSGLNIIIGTGYYGNDILSELKILSSIISKNSFSFENLLRMSTHNPSVVFGIENVTGSIERNKSADLIFFSTDDIRNTVTTPEIESESISDFIVQNLTVKDISDVILKGEIILKNKNASFQYLEPVQKKVKEISNKIYNAGKYYEYKEKYLMRGRVDKLSSESIESESEEVKKEEEIFVDMTEIEEYLGEGEFTILGPKEEEFEKPRTRDKSEQSTISISLKEISSIENELNLFDEDEESQQLLKYYRPKREIDFKTKAKEETSKDSELFKDEKIISYDEDIPEEKEEVKVNTVFKEKKLKFGFGDTE